MKLVIQIPCLNEETTLPVTVADLPRVAQEAALARELPAALKSLGAPNAAVR